MCLLIYLTAPCQYFTSNGDYPNSVTKMWKETAVTELTGNASIAADKHSRSSRRNLRSADCQ
jgi:hypothetical protein